MMKKITFFLGFLCFIALFSACSKEEKSISKRNILVPPPKDDEPDTIIHKLDEFNVLDTVPWVGSTYKVSCQRYTNDSLAYVKMDNGKMFRDNLIKVTITRSDNSVFFEKVFRKSIFDKFFNQEYARQNVLLGMVLEKEKTDKNNLYFLGTVGNPIELMDEFMLFEIVVSKMGDVSINKMELDENKPEEDEK
ncbi:MAG: DUF4738 domain-containing protein [Prevotella sp.]|nr:DUF4738 domain-containing protein [Prevotella sp.]